RRWPSSTTRRNCGSASSAKSSSTRTVRSLTAGRAGRRSCPPGTVPSTTPRARDLLPAAGLTDEERRALLEPAAFAEVGALEKAKPWDGAVARAQALADAFPGHLAYQDRVAEVLFAAALAGVSTSPSAEGSRQQAEQLLRRIGRLELWRRDYPHSPACYD